jgi:hypothetical protein
MFGGPGRLRTIADAVNDLTAELKRFREDLSSGRIKPDGAAQYADRALSAVAGLTSTLDQTNGQLRRLSQTPLIGMLGGGAEAEIQRLTGRIDGLTAVLRSVQRG